MKNLRILFITFFIFLFLSGCQTVKQKTDAAIEKEKGPTDAPPTLGEVLSKGPTTSMVAAT